MMSVAEPEDSDKLFAQLAAQLDMEIPTDVEDLTKIPDQEIMVRVNEIDRTLASMHQLLHKNPDTQEARDLHSKRAALLVEARNRGMR